MIRPRGLFVLDASAFELIYGPDERRAIAERVDLIAPPQTKQSLAAQPELLKQVDVLFSGWGCPVMDRAFLEAAPNLRVVFYGAGAVGYFMTESVWDRGVVVTTSSTANAI